jgi:glycosyltransferase involved in cell wall biosynthesis
MPPSDANRPPRVSVVIPACNSAGTLARALDSVVAQTFSDLEIVLADDASADDTVRVAFAWAERTRLGDDRFRVVRLPRNLGPAGARNRGVAASRGPWVAFLDADDSWLAWRLEAQMEIAARFPDGALLCAGNVGFRHPVGRPSSEDLLASCVRLSLEDFAVVNPVTTSSVLVRREQIDAAGGFDEAFRGPEDYELWMRIAARAPAVKTTVPLVRYDDRPGSLSTSDLTFLPQVLRVLDKAYGPGGVLRGVGSKRRAQAYHCLACSWMAAERGALGRAALLYARGVSLWPFPFRNIPRMRRARLRLLAYLAKRMTGAPPIGQGAQSGA